MSKASKYPTPSFSASIFLKANPPLVNLWRRLTSLVFTTEQYDERIEGVTSVVLDTSDQIQSVGVENLTLKDVNYNEDGDILLQVW